MQDKKGKSSKRSVTAPITHRRDHTPLRSEEGATHLVKLNPYKIARATSYNVFMEYGATAANAGMESDPVIETPKADVSQVVSSQVQKEVKETKNTDLADNVVKISETPTVQPVADTSPSLHGNSANEQLSGESARGQDDPMIFKYTGSKDSGTKLDKPGVLDSHLDQSRTTRISSRRSKEVENKKQPDFEENSLEMQSSQVGNNQMHAALNGAENHFHKKKKSAYSGVINHDGDKSSESLGANIINTGSEFASSFHFDQIDKHVEKRDATVIYTRKYDSASKHEQGKGQGKGQGPESGDHSCANSPLSESTNRTRTGVKSKFGSDLVSLNLSGPNNIESEDSLYRRLSASMNFEGAPTIGKLAEKDGNGKRVNSESSISGKSNSMAASSRWKVGIAISVSVVFAGMVLGGLLIAIYILSHGTRNSVDSYFNNGKNNPHLRELFAKHLSQEEPFGVVSNSVDGLSIAAKGDNEVTDLMKGVSNIMFHGIAYSPNNALEPHCQFTKRDAMLDLAKISTITTRIRTYGMQCEQAELILDAIDHMNLNMTLAMGVWIGKNDTLNRQQMDMMKKVIAKHPDPSRVINSIFIGNEVLFRGDKTRKELIEYIHDAKRFLQVMKIDDIPVGTSEIGSLIDSELLINCDIVGANIQPFFGGVSVEDATHWVLHFLDFQILPHNENIDTPIVITEVGWPSGGGRYRYGQAGVSSLKIFLSTFLCTMRELPLEYYFFEAYDEPWKEVFWTSNQQWETQWGIFNADRSSKFPLQNLGCI